MSVSKTTIISTIALSAIVLAVGVWRWERNDVDKREKTDVRQERARKEKSNINQDKVELVWYNIPELKIKFEIDKVIADDLVYKYKGDSFTSKNGSVFFSSKKLSVIPGCGVSKGPLGALFKLSDKPNDYADKDYFLAREYRKQFNKFFVIYEGPQAVCASREDVKKWEKYFNDNPKFKGWIVPVFKTIEEID